VIKSRALFTFSAAIPIISRMSLWIAFNEGWGSFTFMNEQRSMIVEDQGLLSSKRKPAVYF